MTKPVHKDREPNQQRIIQALKDSGIEVVER